MRKEGLKGNLDKKMTFLLYQFDVDDVEQGWRVESDCLFLEPIFYSIKGVDGNTQYWVNAWICGLLSACGGIWA